MSGEHKLPDVLDGVELGAFRRHPMISAISASVCPKDGKGAAASTTVATELAVLLDGDGRPVCL